MRQGTYDTITGYAASSRTCLKKAFWRRAPRIAEAMTALDKPIGARTLRMMTEENHDVRRRNILENTCLLLGACFVTSPKTFEIVWLFLETYADTLRGRVRSYQNFDEAFVELKYAYITCERAYYRNETEKMPDALQGVDESLKGVIAHMNLRP